IPRIAMPTAETTPSRILSWSCPTAFHVCLFTEERSAEENSTSDTKFFVGPGGRRVTMCACLIAAPISPSRVCLEIIESWIESKLKRLGLNAVSVVAYGQTHQVSVGRISFTRPTK